jgi:isoleucyl-tRNA synthetase
MRGHRVERRFGWDCHGLPAETEAERELGVSGLGPITEFGIDKFNDYCRQSVLQYTQDWRRYVTRQARWVDFEHDYKTMDLTYMESVMWALKRLWDRGLLYEGYRVLPYCWECETPLSNFETRQDDSYRDRQDPAVTVWFELEGEPGYRILVWTTTPWTLTSNLAVAVGPDIEYAVFEEDGHRYVLGAATAPAYAKQLAGATPAGTIRGEALVGRRYRPLFPYFAEQPGAFRVLSGDFVWTEEGTGVVHMAPGFGEDDQRVCELNGIAVVCPVDSRGRFTEEVVDFAGMQVFEANQPIIRHLHERGMLVRQDSYVHSYPHCWRTDTPLIYKAVSSWFVQVTAIRERMLELNKLIEWVPEHVRDGAFGKWLENARDWSISRNRFWGSPIPVWKSDDPAYPRIDVYGTLDELEADFGARPTDLHRPAIDTLTRPNPDDPTGRATMRRVTDVLDCWFESGAMPFAQMHYPFDNSEWLDGHFPADFIVEYIGQTRGWFYTLHVLGTALFDKPPFRVCLAHGVVLGNDGRKASKRLRNFPDPDEVFESLGADAVRWALLSSPVLRGGDLIVDRTFMVDAQRQALLPIWNTWYFFTLYANSEGYRATRRTDSDHVLDGYILAKTSELVDAVTARMDAYDLSGACTLVAQYLDALTNWYIRRSRDRFWAGDADAFDTLATVLDVLLRLCAPLLPMLADHLWLGLMTAEGAAPDASVHLADWPASGALPARPELVAVMDQVRDVCSAASSIRKARGLRVRLPMASVTVATADAEALAPFVGIIADEVNVKDVVLTTDVAAHGAWVLQLVPGILGPRAGSEVQTLLRAVKAGEWSRGADGTVTVAGRALADDEFTLRLVPADDTTGRALPGDRGIVVADVTSRPDLEAEGVARDVIRLVQQARRSAGLHVSDRIELWLDCTPEVAEAVSVHRDRIQEQTLATAMTLGPPPPEIMAVEEDLDGVPVGIGIRKHV